MRDDCSFCWYLWNWWQSLFKLSFHNKQTIKHWDKFESTRNNNTISIVNNNINIDNTSMISVAKWHLCLFCKQCFRQIVWISIRTNDWFICQAKKIHVWFLRYRHLYLRSMSFFSNSQIGFQFINLCPFSSSQIGVQFSNLWPVLTFSNRRPMTSLTYALTITLTNNSAIRSENLERTPIGENP